MQHHACLETHWGDHLSSFFFSLFLPFFFFFFSPVLGFVWFGEKEKGVWSPHAFPGRHDAGMVIRNSFSTTASHFRSAASAAALSPRFAALADIVRHILIDLGRPSFDGLLARDDMAEFGILHLMAPQGVFGDLRGDGGDRRNRIALITQLFDTLTDDRFDPFHLLGGADVYADNLRAGMGRGEDSAKYNCRGDGHRRYIWRRRSHLALPSTRRIS